MPKTKAQKQELMGSLQEKLAGMKAAVFINFFKTKVKDINQLRNDCRAQSVDYMVAKKTILNKALKEKGFEAADYEGEVAALFSSQDEVVAAKLANDFAKKNENIKLVGGILEGKVIDVSAVKALAVLPSKQELLSKVVGSIASPLSGMLNVLQGNLRNFVYALNAIREKKS